MTKKKENNMANQDVSLVKTAAQQMWDEIKDLKIEMFALPDQRVNMYCKPVEIDPSKLFLLVTAGSVLTALELVISPKYVIEKMDRFLVVTPAPKPLKLGWGNMPFDEEEDVPTIQSQKIGLKNVSSQKSIFDSMPKKPSQEDLNTKVIKIQERASAYKIKMAELGVQFRKLMADKTLLDNKNIFQKELEVEVLKNMIKLAQEINSDFKELEGDGSVNLIALIFGTCLGQRDRINNLEYMVSELKKKFDAIDKK